MARSEIPMVINLRQNKNDDSTAYGKYFAECDSKEPLNLKGFAAHMTAHGKIADYQMCVLVLGQVVDCMKELLTQGQPVKLDGFGTSVLQWTVRSWARQTSPLLWPVVPTR